MVGITHNDVRNNPTGISHLMQVSLDTIAQPGSSSTILNSLLKAARLQLGMDIAFISHFDKGRRIFKHVDKLEGLNIVEIGASDPLTTSYCQRVVDGRLPQLIQNAHDFPATRGLRVIQQLDIGGHISTPIIFDDGTVFGTFCCFSFQEDYSLNDRDLSFLQSLAKIAGKLLQKDEWANRELQHKKARIRALLDGDDFSVVWQPILSITSGTMVGVEALSRFPIGVHPGPAKWFAEAATAGLADEMEMCSIAKGLEILKLFKGREYVTCNVSAAALLSPRFTDNLQKQPLDRMLLEISEHDIVKDYDRLREILQPLRDAGLRIAIDDAGTGYASMHHILQLHPEVIKLDMSLVRDIDSNLPKRSLAMSMVMFAKSIGSKLVAEGVETRSEMETLTKLGVDMVQGYHVQHPTTLAQIEEFMDRPFEAAQ